MKVLVTGGAGYIGSVVTSQLVEAGHEVTVLDDLSTGHADAVPEGAAFVEGRIQDTAAAAGAALAGQDAVLHFAAKSLVGESMVAPSLYWNNNVSGTRMLLDAMREAGVARIVFSSSAATYGEPDQVPILETAPTRPTNPYGATKVAVDLMLDGEAAAYGMAATSLRYFNVAGARGALGERHGNETHLIPIALQVALGDRAHLSVFGDDYPTDDGTCIRDYIHVEDLGRAHLLALEAAEPGIHEVYNLGSGTGFSVQQIVDVVREVTGHPLPTEVAPRRDGDPAVLIASSAKAAERLGWHPEKPDLPTIIGDAWAFTTQIRGNR